MIAACRTTSHHVTSHRPQHSSTAKDNGTTEVKDRPEPPTKRRKTDATETDLSSGLPHRALHTHSGHAHLLTGLPEVHITAPVSRVWGSFFRCSDISGIARPSYWDWHIRQHAALVVPDVSTLTHVSLGRQFAFRRGHNDCYIVPPS